MDIQFGLDIATSISIIGAAISFFISQRQSRNKKRDFYIYEKLSKIVVIVADYKYEINKLISGMNDLAKKNQEEPKQEFQQEYNILGLKLKNKCFDLHKIFSIQFDILKGIANENEKESIKTIKSKVDYLEKICKDDKTLVEEANSGNSIKELNDAISKLNKAIVSRLQ